MNDATTWIVIAGLALITVITRSFFLVLGDHLALPDRVQHALRYAPACALTALLAPEVVTVQGQIAIAGNPKLVAAAVAAIAMLVSRNMIVAIAASMAAFTLLRFS